MTIAKSISNWLNDPFKTFKYFEIIIAVVCIAIPELLKLADTGSNGFRPSISDYVYMKNSYIYGMLLSIAAMLFLFNGALYLKNQYSLKLSWAGKWYNVILGLSLLLVILLPYKSYATAHYIFAGLFFGGNAIVIAIFHKKEYRIPSLILACLTLLAFIFHFFFHICSLFAAEWISLAVIGIHFILETTVFFDRASA